MNDEDVRRRRKEILEEIDTLEDELKNIDA